MRRRRLVSATLTAGLMLLAACTFGDDDADPDALTAAGDHGTDVLTPEQMIEEYNAATQNYELPPGMTWAGAKDLPPAPDQNGVMRGNSYEPGYGTTTAEFEWICAWEKAYLDADGPGTEAATDAITHLSSAPDTLLYRISDAGFQASLDDRITRLRLGDASAVEYDHRINCPS